MSSRNCLIGREDGLVGHSIRVTEDGWMDSKDNPLVPLQCQEKEKVALTT